MEFFVILIIIAAVGYGIYAIAESSGKSQMGEDGWNDFKKAVAEADEKKKYNDYMFTCPMCGSKKAKKISDLNRASSIAVFGVASSKIGKQYECDNCNYKW